MCVMRAKNLVKQKGSGGRLLLRVVRVHCERRLGIYVLCPSRLLILLAVFQ
jgi:hypothetical protein